jgi:hypothetical protein
MVENEALTTESSQEKLRRDTLQRAVTRFAGIHRCARVFTFG